MSIDNDVHINNRMGVDAPSDNASGGRNEIPIGASGSLRVDEVLETQSGMHISRYTEARC